MSPNCYTIPNCPSGRNCSFCDRVDGVTSKIDLDIKSTEKIVTKLCNKHNLMKTLCLLYVNEKSIVDKEYIIKFVWNSRVTENSITQTIYQLRMLLHGTNFKLYNFRGIGYGLVVKK